MFIRAQLTITDPYEAFEVLQGEVDKLERPPLGLRDLTAMIRDLQRVLLDLTQQNPFGAPPRPGILGILKGITAPGCLFKSDDGRSFMLYPRHFGGNIDDLSEGRELSVNVFDFAERKAVGIGTLSPLAP